MIETLGILFAVIGSTISVIGNLVNTITNQHRQAIKLWTASSAMIAIWAAGYLAGIWDGGIGVAAILGMNCVFLVSNLWGLTHK